MQVRRRVNALAALLTVFALSVPQLAASAQAGTRTASAVPISAYDIVRPHRWGPIVFGQTINRARNRGAVIRFDRTEYPYPERGCGSAEVWSKGRRIGWVMVWRINGYDKIVRADFSRHTRAVRTSTGVSLGMTKHRLLARAQRLGWNISVEHHPYGGPGDVKVKHRVMRDGKKYAFVYDVMKSGDRRRVVEIYAGKPLAASLIEGCY